MTRVVRAIERYHGTHDGIESWNCFSAGPSYDAANVAFGPLIGCDEHIVAPGRGFDWHGHRNVQIVSWVVSGQLRHEDRDGRVRLVPAGQSLLQNCGSGIRHCEVNGSRTDALRFVQLMLLGGPSEPSVSVGAASVELAGGRFDVWHDGGSAESSRWQVFVTSGSWQLDGFDLQRGDSARGDTALRVTGAGELLVAQFVV